MKTILFIILFIMGSMFSLASWGESQKPRKRIYIAIAIGVWLLLLILANTIL